MITWKFVLVSMVHSPDYCIQLVIILYVVYHMLRLNVSIFLYYDSISIQHRLCIRSRLHVHQWFWTRLLWILHTIESVRHTGQECDQRKIAWKSNGKYHETQNTVLKYYIEIMMILKNNGKNFIDITFRRQTDSDMVCVASHRSAFS